MTHLRLTPLTLALPLAFVCLPSATARANSFSESMLGFPLFVSDSGTASSSIASGNNSASSSVAPATETMHAKVASDGSVAQVRTGASVGDDWFCPSCSALMPPIDIAATIGFDVMLSPNIGELNLEADYTIGSSQFVFSASRDSSPLDFGATWNGNPIDVASSTDQDGNIVLSAIFTGTFICPCFSPGGAVFSDQQSISIEMEGSGFINAGNTFTVSLSPVNSDVVLVSANGRQAGGTRAVPEPGSALLLGAGLTYLARRRLRSARHPRECPIVHTASSRYTVCADTRARPDSRPDAAPSEVGRG